MELQNVRMCCFYECAHTLARHRGPNGFSCILSCVPPNTHFYLSVSLFLLTGSFV